MNLGTFHTSIMDIVNESSLIDTLVWSATRRAAKWIERKYSFQYMKEFSYFQFNGLTSSIAISSSLSPVGASDAAISNSVSNDGQIRLTSILTPYYTAFRVGDYIQFDILAGHFSAGYDGLAGIFGQVIEVNVSDIGGNLVIAIPSDAGLANASEFQPITFTLHKLKGNPFSTGSHHPGLISVGPRLKAIDGDILICDEDDVAKVLRKVKRLGTFDTDVNDESWDSSKTGDIPAGYSFLGRAGNVDQKLLGTSAVASDESLLLFRPIPDKSYWTGISLFRFTDWPVIYATGMTPDGVVVNYIDDDFEHFLLEEGEDVLLARTIIELSPALRDPELRREYSEIFQAEWQTLIASDIERTESDDEGRMQYDSSFSR